jgi:hypothetical protein
MIEGGTTSGVAREPYVGWLTFAGGTAMPFKESKPSSVGASSEGIMADISLGVTVTSLYTLVGLGIVLAFM